MESNLLINHPASLDTVTALKRDSDACISTPAHQSVAQQKLYVRFISTPSSVGLSVGLICRKHEPCVYICGSGSSYLQVGCWDGSRRVIILVTTSARSRFPGLSNHLCIAHTFSAFWLWMRLQACENLQLYSISTSAPRFPG